MIGGGKQREDNGFGGVWWGDRVLILFIGICLSSHK